jgi:hypothetical protein
LKNATQYIAIIGDLVESRKLVNRDLIQENLNKTLQSVNNSSYNESIRSKFVITLGDEFQGLVSRDFPLRQFLSDYDNFFGQNINTRFGIGLGELSTSLNIDAIGMDGSCFHNARAALNQSKKENNYIVFNGFEMNEAINALFQLVNDIKKHWKKRQIEVISIYENVGDQVSVAKKLNITRQTVNEIIRASKYELFKLGWTGIQQLIIHESETAKSGAKD